MVEALQSRPALPPLLRQNHFIFAHFGVIFKHVRNFYLDFYWDLDRHPLSVFHQLLLGLWTYRHLSLRIMTNRTLLDDLRHIRRRRHPGELIVRSLKALPTVVKGARRQRTPLYVHSRTRDDAGSHRAREFVRIDAERSLGRGQTAEKVRPYFHLLLLWCLSLSYLVQIQFHVGGRLNVTYTETRRQQSRFIFIRNSDSRLEIIRH